MPFHRVELPADYKGQPMRFHAIRVSAGFPSPAADDIEDEVDPFALIARNPISTFWMRVEGDCLYDLGIRDGDYIAVDRSGKRRVGRAVLAVIDGAFTAKILRKRGGRYYLASANRLEDFPDLELTPESEIWGVVAGVVRPYPIE